MDDTLTVLDVCDLLGVSYATVYKYRRLRGLPLKKGRITKRAFDAWRKTFTPPDPGAKRRRTVDPQSRPVVISARIQADRTRSRTQTRKLTPQQRRESAARYWSGAGWTIQDLA